MISSQKSICIFVILGGATILGASASYQDEITLTTQEKAALDKFKALVIPKIPVSSYIQHYKNDDLYFIRWVRTSSRSLDVAAAEKAFLNHLKWREDQQIDTILDEDWSEFERDFPAYTGGVDKTGTPAFEAWLADWNLRQAALTGKSKQIVRWVAKNFEQTNRNIYSSRAEGKQITQGVGILSLEGFNLVRNACPACLPMFAGMAVLYESHYKGMIQSFYMMGAPPAFQVVLRLVQAIAPDLAKLIKTFTNKEEGLKALDKRFDKDQRSLRFGGTVTRNNVI